MQRDALYLVDIVEAVRQIGAWLDGVSAADWNADHMLRSSVMWQIVTIGEASSAIYLRDQFPELAKQLDR